MEDVYLKATPTHFWPSNFAGSVGQGCGNAEMSYPKALFSFIMLRKWKSAGISHQATILVVLLHPFFIINSNNRATLREVLQPHFSWINPTPSLHSSHIGLLPFLHISSNLRAFALRVQEP